MAYQACTPLILNTPVRRKDAGLIEVGFNLALAALAFHFPFHSVDTNQAPKRPVYTQVDPVPNSLIQGIPAAPKPFYSVDLTQVNKRPVYVQQEQVINKLPSGLPGVYGQAPTLDLNIFFKRPVYVQQEQVLNYVILAQVIPAAVFREAVTLKHYEYNKKPYQQIDPISNILIRGLANVKPPFNSVETTLTPKKPIYNQVTDVQAPVFNSLLLTVIPRVPLFTDVRPRRSQTTDISNVSPLVQIIPPTGPPFFSVDTSNPARKPIYLNSGTSFGGERFAPTGSGPPAQPPFFQTNNRTRFS